MTTFERFERDVPGLMTELVPSRVPDYFDDMLRETAKHRQRPAWSYLERWLPMGALAQAVPVRPLPWRPILILALIGALIATGLAVYIGSQPTRLPPPFGPARNGQIVFSTADRDISAVDPATGAITPLLAGPTADFAPWFSPDGRQFVFVRDVDGAKRSGAKPTSWQMPTARVPASSSRRSPSGSSGRPARIGSWCDMWSMT